MSNRFAVYESEVVAVTFGGLLLGDGRSDPFFVIEQDGDAYVVEGPGADGLVTRCGTNNNVYTITLTFKGSSSENAKLSALHNLDRQNFNGAGVASLLCKDSNGSTLIQTDTAWIKKSAGKSLGITPGDVSWEITAIIQPGGFIAGGN